MSDPRGIVTVDHGGRSYRLEMNFGVLGDLETEFGKEFTDVLNGAAPSINIVLRAIALALIEGEPGLDAAEAARVARRLSSAKLMARLMDTAFSDSEAAASGNVKGPKRGA